MGWGFLLPTPGPTRHHPHSNPGTKVACRHPLANPVPSQGPPHLLRTPVRPWDPAYSRRPLGWPVVVGTGTASALDHTKRYQADHPAGEATTFGDGNHFIHILVRPGGFLGDAVFAR